jgi:hypothetical protein
MPNFQRRAGCVNVRQSSTLSKFWVLHFLVVFLLETQSLQIDRLEQLIIGIGIDSWRLRIVRSFFFFSSSLFLCHLFFVNTFSSKLGNQRVGRRAPASQVEVNLRAEQTPLLHYLKTNMTDQFLLLPVSQSEVGRGVSQSVTSAYAIHTLL